MTTSTHNQSLDPDGSPGAPSAQPMLREPALPGTAISAAAGAAVDVDNRAGLTIRDSQTGDISIDTLVLGDVYQRTPTPPVNLEAARALLGTMPTATIPEPAPLPPRSRMPFRRNPLFVGRRDDLRALARLFAVGSAYAVGQLAAATGLGGIGKTNLATEFVHRYGQYFAGGVYWLSFADPAAIPTEVAACGAAGLIDHPNWGSLRPDDQVRLVRAAWEEPVPRLLVFDNCDDSETASAEDLLRQWCPAGGGASVLVTSRSGAWDEALGVTRCAIGVLARVEAMALLRRLRPELSDVAANAIAATVGDLPLALHLSASFLKAYPSVSPGVYLGALRGALLAHPALEGRGTGMLPTGHERHVARTFALSYGRLGPADGAARALLARAACLAPGEPIPRELLLATLTRDGVDGLQAEDGLRRLIALGLLDEEPGGALILHRLLTAFVEQIGSDERAPGAVEAQLISQVEPCGWDFGALRARGRPVEAHLRHVAERALQRGDLRAARLGELLGDYLQVIYAHDEALQWYERALPLWRQHGDLAGEAGCLKAMGDAQLYGKDLDAAHGSYQEALARFRQVGSPLGEASCLRAVGEVMQFRQELDAALRAYRQSLVIYRQVGSLLGEASCLRAIGEVMQFRQELDSALQCYRQALARFRHVGSQLGEANCLKALGDVYRYRDDHDAASASYQRALALYRQIGDCVGEANCLRAMGDAQQLRKELESAFVSYHKAQMLYRQIGDRMGEAHCLLAIGDARQQRKELYAALASYHQARTLYRQIGSQLGEANCFVSQSNALVADALRSRELFERALALYRELGSGYSIGSALYARAVALLRCGQTEAALGCLREARAVFQRNRFGGMLVQIDAAIDFVQSPMWPVLEGADLYALCLKLACSMPPASADALITTVERQW
jgi:tetratricopeptide (TPR) repeat protein